MRKAVLVSVLVMLTATLPQTWAGHFYANPFASNLVTNYGKLSNPSDQTGYTVGTGGNVLAAGVDQQGGNYNISEAKMTRADNIGTFMSWTADPFTAGTVIINQNPSFGSFTGTNSFRVKLGTNTIFDATTTPDPTNGAPIHVVTLPSLTSASSVTEEITSAVTVASNYYYLMQEVLVLPDRLQAVPPNGTPQTSVSSFFSNLTGYRGDLAVDSTEVNGWAAQTGNSGEYITMNWGQAVSIDALLLANWDTRVQTFNVFVNGSPTAADTITIGGDSGKGSGDFKVWKFDSALNGVTSLRLQYTNSIGQLHGFMEAMPLQFVPEPASLALLALGGLAALRRRCRRA